MVGVEVRRDGEVCVQYTKHTGERVHVPRTSLRPGC